jgi:carotenoid cleavage dioxygenase-like enzyme
MIPYQRGATQTGLSGGYRPVTKEIKVFDLPVTGELPPVLNGTFMRIGPNPLRDCSRRGLFAGEPMVHGVRLRDGRAEWYGNRWIRTDRVCGALGEDATPGPRHGLSDNCNSNLVLHGGRVLATGDGGVLPTEVGADLSTLSRMDFRGTLPNGLSAHPELDRATGELHAVAYYHDLGHVQYLTIDASGRVRQVEPIEVKNTPMMHAFSLTKRHAILYDLPVTFSAAAAESGLGVPYAWDDDHGARIGIVPRGGGDADVRWIEIPPCYVFHPLNAYEQGNHIIAYVVQHQRAFDRDPLYPSESAPELWRWTIDLVSGTVVTEQADGFVEEFPRIDERFKGVRNRYGFATALRRDSQWALAGPGLLRHDTVRGRTDVHHFGRHREGGEAAFVPRSPDAPEGDGWLMTFVYDKATDRSDLVIVDTADFGGEPAAVISLPARVPHGFHATWLPAD